MINLNSLLLSSVLIFSFSGCVSKIAKSYDEQEILQVPIVDATYGSKINKKITDKWEVDLQSEIEDFIEFVDVEISAIDNHKTYLAKTYKVDYYNPIIPENSDVEKKDKKNIKEKIRIYNDVLKENYNF